MNTFFKILVIMSMGLLLQRNVCGNVSFMLSGEYIQALTVFGANNTNPSITFWAGNNEAIMIDFNMTLPQPNVIKLPEGTIGGAINLPLYEGKFCPSNSFMFDTRHLKSGTLYFIDLRIVRDARQECAYCDLMSANDASAPVITLGPKILNAKRMRIKKEPVQ
jgi:hypothetical protein